MTAVEIPGRSVFRAPEVCELAGLQPYVLRSWEAEFPDLGVARRDGGPRVYRRSDVERVLRLKELVFVEGLTLGGARRRLTEEVRPEVADDFPIEELLGRDVRERLVKVRDELREVVQLLSGSSKEAGRQARHDQRRSSGGQAVRGSKKGARPRRP